MSYAFKPGEFVTTKHEFSTIGPKGTEGVIRTVEGDILGVDFPNDDPNAGPLKRRAINASNVELVPGVTMPPEPVVEENHVALAHLEPQARVTPETLDIIRRASCPHLPAGAAERKAIPLATGLLDYFPDALAAVAALSYAATAQHHPGEPCHWDRTKSADEADTLMRHFLDRGTLDTDGQRHSTKVAWRALALLQKEIEAARAQEQG